MIQFRNLWTLITFWTKRAICFKFGTEDRASLRRDHKTTPKWPESCDLISFGPLITFLLLPASNLVDIEDGASLRAKLSGEVYYNRSCLWVCYTARWLAAVQCIVIGPVCGFVCLRVCVCGSVTRTLEIACIDPHQTGFVNKGSDHLQLIKFWPSCTPGKGVCGGAKIFGSTYYSQRTVFASLWVLFHCCVFPRPYTIYISYTHGTI